MSGQAVQPGRGGSTRSARPATPTAAGLRTRAASCRQQQSARRFASPAASHACQAGQDDGPGPQAALEAQPAAGGSPRTMLALMQAWGSMSGHLQQQQQQQQQQQDATRRGEPDDDTAQLILAALKLAVRSLSRVPASAASGSASASGVQRSLALAAALAELYATGLPLDAASIAAGIVADAVDAGALHIRTVHAQLGPEAAGLVHDLLAVRHAPERAPVYDDPSTSALRGWLLAAYDVRACAIEVVWRWLALAQPPPAPAQQQLAALEALTVFCPLGHALGLGSCAAALEDAAFKVLFPSSYASTARAVLPVSGAAQQLLASCQAWLQAAADADAAFGQLAGGLQLLGRTKSLYSIMRKLLRLSDPAAGSRCLGEMYDLLGLRAVVLPRADLPADAAEAAAVQACYRLLELAHQQWAPVPGRSKDYIASPKSNGYQSLHSTLHLQAPGGSSSGGDVVLSYLELQVRTASMHAAAEGGDAAHTAYKGRLEQQQVRQLQQWTAQLQQRLALAAPQQQQQQQPEPAAKPSSSSSRQSSSSSGSSLLPSSFTLGGYTSSYDSDAESSDAAVAASSSGSSAELAVARTSSSASASASSGSWAVEYEPAAAAAAAAALFRHLDLDGDGQLSLYELTALLGELGELGDLPAAAAAPAAASSAGAGRRAPAAAGLHALAPPVQAVAPPPPGAHAQQLLEQLDTNGDGLVSMPEFLDYYMRHTSSGSSSSSSSSGGGGTVADAAAAATTAAAAEHEQADTASSSSSSGGGGGGSSGGGRGGVAGAAWSSLHAPHAPAAPAVAFSGGLGSSGRRSTALGAALRGSAAVPSVRCSSSSSSGSQGLSASRGSRCRCCASASNSSISSSVGVSVSTADSGVDGADAAGDSSSRAASGERQSSRESSESGASIAAGGAVIAAGGAVGSEAGAAAPDNNSSGGGSLSADSSSGAAGVPTPVVDGASSSSSSEPSAGAPTASGGAASSSSSSRRRQRPLLPPLRRPEPSPPADAGTDAGTAAAQQVAAVLPPATAAQQDASVHQQQQQQQQGGEQLPAMIADTLNGQAHPAEQQEQPQLQAQQPQPQPQQQHAAAAVFADWTFEEEEQQQQQRRSLRQQQQQLPTLLDDAAAGTSPCYVLVPAAAWDGGSDSSSSGSSSGGELVPPQLLDRLGQQLPALEVPLLGPLLVTNAPQVFKSADVLVDVETPGFDRLAVSLELVKPLGCEAPVLQARNLSRQVRRRGSAAAMHVNGQPLLLPHQEAAELLPGDEVEFGQTGLRLVVLRLDRPATPPAALCVQRYVGLYAAQQLALQLPVAQALQQLDDAQQQLLLQDASGSISSSGSGWGAAADALEGTLRGISRLARSDAAAAERELAQLAATQPGAPGPWFLWAQLAASGRRAWMARDLFRAAAVCQQQQLQALQRAAAAAAEAAPPPPQPQPQQQQPDAGADMAPAEQAASDSSATDAAAAASSSSSSAAVPPAAVPPAVAAASAAADAASAAITSAAASASSRSSSPAFRLSSRLVQVLRVWARSDWDAQLFGPARRLWRLAANEAFRFPYDVAAQGGGAVLHTWATAEFERDNILNARVVIGEALRKCPRDAAVAVLAGSIEAAAGEAAAARALFTRAYSLNRADKQLYMSWPKLEGEAGNVERARLLFQAGLSLHPNNIKILNLYACFEEGQGNVALARELHARALGIDAASKTSMHNRVSWADLELRDGHPGRARALLAEGLDAHPDFPAALLLMAQVERSAGDLDLAEAYARRAQKASHSFSNAAMRELRAIYAARGEDALVANLGRHLAASERRLAAKKAGRVHGSTSWQAFFGEASSAGGERAVMEAAWQRKRELGLIRSRPGAGGGGRGRTGHGAAGGGTAPRQRRGHSVQQQQVVVPAVDDAVAEFDFAGAAAAAAAAAAADGFGPSA